MTRSELICLRFVLSCFRFAPAATRGRETETNGREMRLGGDPMALKRSRILCGTLVALASLCPFAVPAGAPDPVPLRRILVAPERLPQEMERVRQGTLLMLPRKEFEARVAEAARAGEALRNPPRLLEARYRASFTEAGLTGTGQWTVLNPTALPGILPVQPLNLALRQVRRDNADAILADLDGRGPGLLIEAAGCQTVTLDWTARGEPGPAGVHFDLRVPACALTSLEIDLPADRTPVVSRDLCLLSGPFPAEDPNRRLWRIDGGHSVIDLVVARTPAPDVVRPLVLARLQSRQELWPDLVEVEYEIQLEVYHGTLRELTCACDPALRPYEVSFRGLETDGWELRPGPAAAPSALVIRLREPVQGLLPPLRVRCRAALARSPTDHAGPLWNCPALRPAGCVLRGETLVVRVPPSVRLEDWRPGQFHLTRAATDAAGLQTLTLSGTGLTAADATGVDGLQRPAARVRLQGPDWRARQLLWWQVGPRDTTLTAQITFEVSQGQVFQLPVRLPPSWEVTQVELNPPEVLRNWSVSANPARLVVDLNQSLGAGQSAGLLVRLRPGRRGPPTPDQESRFPDVVPEGVRWREGALAVTVDPQYQPSAHLTAVAPAEPGEGPEAAGPRPWGQLAPDLYYPFRGQPPAGTLRLLARQPRLRARYTSEVVLRSGRAVVLTRLLLQPEVGSPEQITVHVSAPVAGAWAWRTVRGSNWVRAQQSLGGAEDTGRLLVLGARTPLEAATLLAVPLRTTSWRLTLARPLREPLALEATLEVPTGPAPPGERTWDVPLVTVPAAEHLEGEATLRLAGTDLVRVETAGLREAAAGSRTGSGLPWRTFHYGPGPVALRLHGRTPPADRSAEAVADEVHLATYVEPGRGLRHHFGFRLWNWRQQTFPLRLPAGARPLAVRVSGRWVSHLVHRGGDAVPHQPDAPARDAAGPSLAHRAGEGGGVLEVPIAAGPLHRVEVVYTTALPAWTLWATLDAPAPGLPVRSLSFRRAWHLPPELAPLTPGALQLLPSPGPADGGAGGEPRLPAGLPLLALGAAEDWADRQRLLVREAVSSLQSHRFEQAPRRLGEVLSYLAFDYLKEQGPLVLDALALAEAGMVPTTPLDPEKPTTLPGLGLVHVPCRAAPLLSTPQQVRTWSPVVVQVGPPSAAVTEAVAEAVRNGHDRTGRFRTVADWLEDGESGDPPDSLASPAASGWTGWEPLPGAAADDALVVVRRGLLPGVTLALCVALALAVWGARRLAARARRWLLLLWLVAGGLGLLWLPESLRGTIAWPALAGFAVAAAWYLRSALAPAKAVTAAAGAGAAAAGLLALLVSVPPGWAVGPGSFTVWLVPGPPPDVHKLSVLAPPDLLDQLRLLSSRGAAGLRGAFLLGGRYEGRVVRGVAEFEAEFQAHCFGEEASLTVPLAGVELLDALLDGAVAYPVALTPQQVGYAFPVKGRGSHTLRLRFSVRLPAGGDERELRFGVPELLASRLTLTAPGEVQYLHAVGGRGAQRVAAGASGTRLEADLGRVGTVQVRWRRPAGTPAEVGVRELYLWDFQPTGTRLLAVLNYSIDRGTATRLELDLPEPLELRRLETEPPPGAGLAARLKDWRLSGTGRERRLTLEFQGPVAEGMQVFLELVPGLAFRPGEPLPLPAPRDAAARESLMAYRVEGVQATVVENRRVTGRRPEEFHEAWAAAGVEDPGPPEKAFVFLRAAGAGPLLRLRWAVPRSRARCDQDLHWHLGPRQAELRAAARLSNPDEDLALLEWHLPAAVTLGEVGGPDVRAWSRVGDRLQVWLQRTAAETTVSFGGWLPRPDAATPFALPAVRCLSAAEQATRLRLTAATGLSLRASELQNLSAAPAPRPGVSGLTYTSPAPDYAGTFRTVPDAGRAAIGVLTFVEVREGRLTFTALVDYPIPERGPRNLTLRLRHWDGSDVHLEAPDAVRRDGPTKDPTERAWALQLKPEARGRYQLRLTGGVALENAADFRVPDVRLEGGGLPEERWLAVAGPELLVEEARGLAVVPEGGQVLGRWPAVADRVRRAGGSAWKIAEADWRLRVRARGAAAAGPTQLFLAERAAAVLDGRQWTHQATYWLYHEAGADLSLLWPRAIDVLSVRVDGARVTPLQPAPARLWLPLPGRSGVRVVEVRWMFPADEEPLAEPHLSLPRVEGVADPPALWAVHVPAGYEVDRQTGDARPATAAGQALRRAAAYLRLSTALASRARERPGEFTGQLLEMQEGFYRSCRIAEHLLTLADRPADAGPNGEGLGAWQYALRAQNGQQAQSQQYEKTRAEAEKRAQCGLSPPPGDGAADHPQVEGHGVSLSAQGTPSHWQAAAGAGPPSVRLAAVPEQHAQRAWLGSGLLLLLVGLAWGLQYAPRVLAWVQALWPEQALGLGLVVYYLGGPLLAAAALAVIGGCARLFYLSRGALNLWSRNATKAAPAVGGSSGSAT
jgi:hypothetical protein